TVDLAIDAAMEREQPARTDSDPLGAWTCGRCGFRGFWSGGPHECAAGVRDARPTMEVRPSGTQTDNVQRLIEYLECMPPSAYVVAALEIARNLATGLPGTDGAKR